MPKMSVLFKRGHLRLVTVGGRRQFDQLRDVYVLDENGVVHESDEFVRTLCPASVGAVGPKGGL